MPIDGTIFLEFIVFMGMVVPCKMGFLSKLIEALLVFPRPNLINPAQNQFQKPLLIHIENPKPQTLRSNHCFHSGTRMVRPFHPKILTETIRELNT